MTLTETSNHGNRQLFCAVINQALEDAIFAISPSDNGTARKNQREARAWFLNAGKDFREVCSLAGMEHERVREYARRKIEEAIAKGEAPRHMALTITYKGETLTIPEWAERTGLTKESLYDRLRRGLPTDQVLSPEKSTSKDRAGTYTFDGKALTLMEWSSITRISERTLYSRLTKLGWTFEEAITTTTEQARKRAFTKRQAISRSIARRRKITARKTEPSTPKPHLDEDQMRPFS